MNYINATQKTAAVKIVVNKNATLHRIQPGLLGVNHRYFINGVGMWDPVNKMVIPAFQKKMEDIGLKAIRYPGGTTANLFQWKKSVGPVEKRIAQVNPYLGLGPEVATFGLDEALRFSEENQLKTIYVYNFGNGNAKDAAELVEYLNAPDDGQHPMATLRTALGHPEPYNIKDFELGNEIFTYYPLVDQEFWLRGESDKSPAQLYVYGGQVKFTDQPVGLQNDWRENTALSDGKISQIKFVKYAPVDPDPAHDVVVVKVGGVVWGRVASLENAGRENVYTLNDADGAIRFGDSNHGNIPPENQIITVTYATTHDGVIDYVREMKNIDPSIKIYTAMDTVDVLKELGHEIPYDGMVSHPYSFFDEPFDVDNIDNYYYASLVDAAAKVDDVRTLQENMLLYSGRMLKPAVTEYALHDPEFKDDPSSSTGTALYYEGSLGAALHTADQLISFINMDLNYALRHSLIDRVFEDKSAVPMALFDTHTFLSTAHAYLYKLFIYMTGDETVQSMIENNPVRTVLVTENGEVVKKELSKLTQIASVSGNEAYLIVLNRDAHDDIGALISLPETSFENVQVWTLDAKNIMDINTDENPEQVIIISKDLNINDNTFKYVFPPHSLTGFKFIGTKGNKKY